MDIDVSIAIGRNSHDEFYIEIQDDKSRVEFARIVMDAESFAMALTGLHGVKCKGVVRGLDVVGKELVNENREATYPGREYDRKKLEQWLLESCKEEGWIIDPYLGSQKSTQAHGENTLIRYRVYKYV